MKKYFFKNTLFQGSKSEAKSQVCACWVKSEASVRRQACARACAVYLHVQATSLQVCDSEYGVLTPQFTCFWGFWWIIKRRRFVVMFTGDLEWRCIEYWSWYSIIVQYSGVVYIAGVSSPMATGPTSMTTSKVATKWRTTMWGEILRFLPISKVLILVSAVAISADTASVCSTLEYCASVDSQVNGQRDIRVWQLRI